MSLNSMFLGISFVYFLAFSSLYIQLPGLAGDDGVQPVRLLTLSAPTSFKDFIYGIQTIVRFKDIFNLSAYHCTEALTLIGMFVSFLSIVSSAMRNTFSLFILWICYFSVVKVVAAFASWRWSLLLIEVGFLCILLSIKIRRSNFPPSAHIITWLLKWLLFRVTFATGYTKLAQKNSEWWSLSAFKHYFGSQLSPTPVAYYLSILPEWMHRFICVTTLCLELITPFLFLVPLHAIQMFSFVTQFMLHFNTMLAGNYGINNILMIVLCLSLLLTPNKSRSFNMRTAASWILSISLIGFTIFVITTLFKFNVTGTTAIFDIGVTFDQFRELSNQAIFYTVPVAAGLFGLTVLYSVYCAMCAPGCINKVLDFTGVLITAILATGLFLASVSSFTSLNGSTNTFIPVPAFLHELKSLHLANDYRYLHQEDADVGYKIWREGRPTLVFYGAMSESGPWNEISFIHAHGRITRMPPIIPGHLPVIDFELTRAAQTSFDKSPFTAILVYRILTQQKDLAQQMELTGFASGPKFIQIKLYNNRFVEKVTGSEWWKRTFKSVFLPPTAVNSPNLIKHVEKSLQIGKRRERPNDPTHISFALDQLRALIGQPRDLIPFIGVLAVIFMLDKVFF